MYTCSFRNARTKCYSRESWRIPISTGLPVLSLTYLEKVSVLKGYSDYLSQGLVVGSIVRPTQS